MKLLGCNQKCIATNNLAVCGLLALGRLRTVGEADSLVESAGDLLYFDYLTIEEEDDVDGEDN